MKPYTVKDIDKSETTYFPVETRSNLVERLLKELFEKYYSKICVGPCIPGSVFEILFTKKPKVSLSDGYMTVNLGHWHFHLCVGQHKGPKSCPTPKKLAQARKVAKAAFFKMQGMHGSHLSQSWGFRMWNGRGEQMLTIFFPNPSLTDKLQIRKRPDTRRLALWNKMKKKYYK